MPSKETGLLEFSMTISESIEKAFDRLTFSIPFPFLIGRLETNIIDYITISTPGFQFLIGRLETC